LNRARVSPALAGFSSSMSMTKWVGRYHREGEAGLADRSSAPQAVADRTEEHRIETIAALRALRMTGPEIAECLQMALSTVSGVLARIGLGKLSRLELPEPPNRYERLRPGELPHRRQEAGQDRRGSRPSGDRQAHRARPRDRLGVRPRLRRRRHPLGLRRGARR